MIDLLLTEDGDLYVGPDGDIQLTNSVRQAIMVRLRWFLGEWKFNPDFGVPYYEEVLVKNPNLFLIEQLLSEQIMNVTEVREVTSIKAELDSQKRSLRVSFAAKTDQEDLREEVIFRV